MLKLFEKINIVKIISDHMATLKDYGKSRYSKLDLFLFFILPLVISGASVYYGVALNKDLVGILINVFSIFAGLLLNLLVLMYSVISNAVKLAKESDPPTPEYAVRIKIDLLEQVFANISFEILLSSFNVILLAVSTLFSSDKANQIFSLLIFYLVVLFSLSLLMVLKRVHKLLSDEITEQRKALNNAP